MYSEKDIQEIRNRVNLVDLVSHYTTLKRSGRSLRGLCPFHSEKTPSFYVDPEKQLYHCFGCGAGGDIFDFVMEMEKLNFNEAVEYLAEKAGVTLTQVSGYAKTKERDLVLKALERAAELFRIYLLKSQEGKKALEYLSERKIGPLLVKEFEIGLSPTAPDLITKKLMSEGFKEKHLIEAGLTVRTSKGLIDRFRGRIMFPIRDIKDKVVGFGGRQFLSPEPKYLNTPETSFFKKGSLLYNLNRAKKYITESDKVLIVEGYTDVIALRRAGFPYVVATLGTALTEVHLSILSRFTSNIYLAFDADTAGKKAAERGIELIAKSGRLNIRVVVLDEGKDPADFVNYYGEDKASMILEKLMANSESIEDFVIKRRLASFDITNPKEKRKAAESIAQIISLIDDTIVRDEYIKKYASYLAVSEDALRLKVGRHKWYNFNIRGSSTVKDSDSRNSSFVEAEEQLLSLLYRNYRNRIERFKTLKPEYLFDDIISLSVKAILSAPEKCSEVKALIEAVRREYGEDAVKRLSGILLKQVEFEGDEERIFDEIIVHLRERYFKKRITELRAELAEAESRGDFVSAQRLLEEIQEIASSLKKERF